MKYLLSLFSIALLFTQLVYIQYSSGRIVNRRVKEAPKVCAVMQEDKLLSKDKKIVYGTLKHSVVIEDDVSVLNDLGKKECQWSFDKLNTYGSVNSFNYYIDEYKNYIYPYFKKPDDSGYTILKVSLSTCEIEDSSELDKLELPKCGKPIKKKRKSVKKKTGLIKKS